VKHQETSFIEVQFPVSKVSKESYKERKAGSGQTLTGLGKWWGRKPLILIRAALLGLLVPASDDPEKDRDIFLKILTMDEEGLIKRKNKSIPAEEVHKYLTPSEKRRYFEDEQSSNKIAYKAGITRGERDQAQLTVFCRMSYDEKLRYCMRPEEVDNLDASEWAKINQHLGTNAESLQELVKELGERRFGKVPVVGDCFCGGGSVPFEAARMGCDVYASDLNPVAALLTWAAININGASEEEIQELRRFQKRVFDLADKQVIEWGIETNEIGDRANAYLYCNETICPECGYKVPLAPSWIIGKSTRTVAILKENDDRGFDIDVISNASRDEMKLAEDLATIQNGNLVCPHCKMSTPIPVIRKDRIREDGSTEYGLRKWGPTEFVPAPDDVFQERLYCIRYEREYVDEKGKRKTERYYQAPTKHDLERERKVVEFLEERFTDWQQKGYIPNSRIEEGDETSRLRRERGWAYWHQLFNPRQLLIQGLLMKLVDQYAETKGQKVVGLLGINKCCNWNSKLSSWNNAREDQGYQTFYNQALNPMFNYPVRSMRSASFFVDIKPNRHIEKDSALCAAADARSIGVTCEVWITDPPYADAINYHEISEFFLAWDRKMLLEAFPNWYADSKRALAVKGTGDSFDRTTVEIYSNLAAHMPDNGMQIIMFTHQDVSVWAKLVQILWASGLQVTAAWCIATETDAGGLKQGNYVKGTVLLVLRKQTSGKAGYLDDVYPEIELEVISQIDSMQQLDDKEDPNFSDTDYLLAAYSASVKVLTSYRLIDGRDMRYELSKEMVSGKESPIEKMINQAVKIAYDYLVPSGFDKYIWKTLTPEERFYIKGLDLEKDGVSQIGSYQELAKGFGVTQYKELLASTRANQARLKTATEFAMKGMRNDDRFGSSLLRNVLAALYQAIKNEDTMSGRNWLRNELPDYWGQRKTVIEILGYIATLANVAYMSHWEQESYYARILAELVKNDGV